MRQYETVERCGRTHVVENGVESECFITPGRGDRWLIFHPVLYDQVSSLKEALAFLSASIDVWHTVPQAAIRLVELGKADKPPALKTVYRWIHSGRLPGAIKVRTGGPGRGGSWRIPETALREFTKRGGEKE